MRNYHGVLPPCVMCKITWTIRKGGESDEVPVLHVDACNWHHFDRSLSNEQQGWRRPSKSSIGERILLVCRSFDCGCNRVAGLPPASADCSERSEPASSFCRSARCLSGIWNCFPHTSHRRSKTDIDYVGGSNTGRVGAFPFWIIRFPARACIVASGIGNGRHVCRSSVDDLMSGPRCWRWRTVRSRL